MNSLNALNRGSRASAPQPSHFGALRTVGSPACMAPTPAPSAECSTSTAPAAGHAPFSASQSRQQRRLATHAAAGTGPGSSSSSRSPQPMEQAPQPQLYIPGRPAKATNTIASAVVAPTRVAAAAPPAEPVFSPADSPYIYTADGQRVHSIHPLGTEVIQSLRGWAETDLLKMLKPIEKCWQPQDLLPDPCSPDFYDEVQALRAASADLPSDYLVALVGDMVTEEALPSYMGMLNRLDGTSDETGAQATPWAQWTRAWTAEENRHGDLLNKYLYLTGKVDMRAVEVTIQNLIADGLDPQLENNPYLCFVYTSFQERATKISHANTARLASYYGDQALTKVCGVIAADEGRHEIAYTNIIDQVFERDPDGAMLAFADMMKKGIVMPAHFMNDLWHGSVDANPGQNLFEDYAAVADSIGVYTTGDYADIVQHLVQRWKVPDVRVVSGQAAEAQEFLCKHSERIRRLADIQMERKLRDRRRGKSKSAAFSWIFKREVSLL